MALPWLVVDSAETRSVGDVDTMSDVYPLLRKIGLLKHFVNLWGSAIDLNVTASVSS